MVYNGTKFQVIRYGNNTEIKDDTNYVTEDTGKTIEMLKTLRDLCVILSEEANLKAHVHQHVENKVRRKIALVLRTFYCRSTFFMKTLFKTLIVPHVDYCSQLWMPTLSTQTLAIEKLQKDFFYRVPALREINYCSS